MRLIVYLSCSTLSSQTSTPNTERTQGKMGARDRLGGLRIRDPRCCAFTLRHTHCSYIHGPVLCRTVGSRASEPLPWPREPLSGPGDARLGNQMLITRELAHVSCLCAGLWTGQRTAAKWHCSLQQLKWSAEQLQAAPWHLRQGPTAHRCREQACPGRAQTGQGPQWHCGTPDTGDLLTESG